MSSKLTSHSESPEISGLLYKKRGGFGKMMPNNWQYRLFILSKEGVLTYYDTEIPENKDIFDSKERGRIDLRGVKFELYVDTTEGAPTPHTIVIQPEEGEKWKLCADTKEDHARWWKVIERFQNEQADKGKAAQLSVQSDDDLDPSTPARRKPSISPRQAETDASRLSSPGGINASSSIDSSSTSPAPTKPVAPAGSKKHRLKLGKEAGLVSQEWMEWSLVVVIVNVCLYGIVRTTSTFDRAFYAIALNAVVAHSLYLRGHRAAVATAKANEHAEAAANSAAASIPSAPRDASPEKRQSFKAASNPRLASQLAAAVGGAGSSSGSTLASPVTTTSDVVAGAASAGKSLMSQGKKPIAGFTMQQVFTEPKLSPEHTWCKADARQFNVRVGPDYNRYKKKAPSGPPIYEAFAVDVFCTKLRADHCSSRFKFADPNSAAPINVDTHNAFVPPVFVIQIQIPSDPPSGFFTSAEDGPGWAILMYYRISEDAVNQLKDLSTASPAVKLFAEWCEKCTEDPLWRGRFKVINSCTNLDELGIPSAISAYNAKPIMIRRTGSITRGDNDGIRYMEMDIHVHKFATLAKQSIHYISSRCGQMYMQIGFVIEGVSDAELPETLFACVAVNKPQEERAEFIFEDDA